MKKTEFSSALLRERYERIEHPSGLLIYYFPKNMTTSYALFAANYGSVDTEVHPNGEKLTLPDGVAHFLEHKLFEDENGEDAFAAFSAYGADVNAYTSNGRTAYLFSTTSHFSECLGELLHFVTHPHFTEESVEREKGIIAEELRMYDDRPWECVYQNLLSALFHTHPVKRRVGGTVASIEKITPALLTLAYNEYYRLSNMALVVCGNVSLDEVLACVEREIGTRQFCEKLPPRSFEREANGVRRPRIEARMQVEKPILCIGIKDTAVPTEGREALRRNLSMNLLCETLFSQSGRFYEEMLEKGLLSSSFSWEYTVVEGVGYVCLSGESYDPDAVCDALWAYLKEVREQGLDRAEFECCRRMQYANEVLSYDSTEEIANNLLSMAWEEESPFLTPELLAEITCEEAEALLDILLSRENSAVSVILPPEENEEGSISNE